MDFTPLPVNVVIRADEPRAWEAIASALRDNSKEFAPDSLVRKVLDNLLKASQFKADEYAWTLVTLNAGLFTIDCIKALREAAREYGTSLGLVEARVIIEDAQLEYYRANFEARERIVRARLDQKADTAS